jgi:hypothetical protein
MAMDDERLLLFGAPPSKRTMKIAGAADMDGKPEG